MGAGSLTRPVSPPTPGTQPPGTPQVITHGLQHEAMQAGSLTLQVNKATRFVGSDGRLDLLVPAGAITAAQQTAAGGAILLKVTQIAPASGSNAGGDLSLGTYLLQLVNAHGALLSFGLSKPITATYHLQANELGLGLDHAYALLNGSVSSTVGSMPGAVAPASGKTWSSTLGARTIQAASLSVSAQTLTVSPLISTPSTSLAWNSDSPIATFGKPDTSSVDLSSGSLSEGETIAVPPGPGGLTPPVSLTYSSEAVNGQHDSASAAGWVGEGWNLSLGEITWSEHNVVAGCTPQPSCGSNWQNEWFLNDAYGTSSQLIPPNVTASTYYDSTSNTACQLSNPSVPCPILWHTANESHDQIYAYVGNVTIPSESINPVCWRVWLPNGIMEEFGCTSGSLQYFYVQGGHAEVTGWDLDMITDPAGNQIHFTYQSDMENWTDPSTHTVYSYPRDVELASIQYDSPGCLNAQTMCTGSAWAPQMQVVFNASHSPAHLTGSTPTGCNTGSNLRCDDPVSESGGVAAPLIQSTFVLNSIQTQVRTSGTGTWNTLATDNLSYEQSGPTTITDPPSGQSASAAGMLDLTQFQEVGSDGSTTLPPVTFAYGSQANYYVDSWFKPNPSTNCGPSWNTGNGSGCLLWASNSVISSGSAQSTPTGNNRFLTSLSNGQGLAQSFLWSLARDNSHGVNGGGSNNADPFYCNDHQSGYPCNEADDSGWSQVVLTQENDTTERVTQNGQGGTQTTTPITQVTGYTYQLTYPLPSQQCSDCVAGMYWGDQNDNDYLSYYNGIFMGFAQATVNEPDGSVEVHHYYAGQGWGIYDSSQVTCYTQAPCHNDPWWNLANAAHGDEYQDLDYDANGETLTFVGTNNGNWNTVQSQTTSVALQAGNNSITFSNLASWAPNIDRIVVNGTSYEAEASANTLSGGAVVATCSACSGGKEVGFIGEGGVLEVNNVSVASAGTYSMTIYYVDGDAGRAATISLSALKLLKEVDTTYTATCPPTGVSPTPPNGSITWDHQLISDLDHNNPVAVCDIDQTQQISKTSDGSSNTLTTTTNWTYDSYDRVTQQTTTTNGGTPAEVVKNTAYVWDDHVTATRTSATGTYLIDTPAFTDTEDGSGNRLACSYTSYDGQSYTTGQTSSVTEGLATTTTSYSNCGTSANGYTTSGPSTTTTTYNSYGDAIATDDPDANAGISGHTGCTVSSTTYTTCTAYDGTFDVFPTSSANALNQTNSTSYATTSAAFGYGTWPASTTDENGQTTSYTYDALGRMTGEVDPGETSGDLTKQWVYTNWCSGTSAQTPCEEIDEIDRLNSTTTTTTRAFYDGNGNLVETRAPGYNGQDVVTYAYYDSAGRQIFKSNPYFVTAYTGAPGSAAYSIPDNTQPGTTTNYYPNAGIVSLLTTSVTDPNSFTTTTTDSVICGVSGTSDAGCYEQKMVVDANGHESATLTGGLGQTNYTQTYTGISGSYALYATTTATYNAAGDKLTTASPDGSTYTAGYDDRGRMTSESDPDRGTTTFTYDPNGNAIESVDARGSTGTVYTGYDGLNRPLWSNNTNSSTGAWETYTYDSTTNGNDGIGKLTGESFIGSGGLSGSYAYTYDNRGQQIDETVTVDGTNYPLQVAYNDAGQTTSETYPDGEIVTPGYSSTDWLLGLSTAANGVTTNLATNIAYTGLAGAAGRVTSMNLGNSIYSYSASYDIGMRLTSASLSDTSGGTQLYQTQPTYDAASNVVGVSTAILGQTDIQQFCYDSLNRLTWSGTSGTPSCSGVNFNSGTLTAANYQQSYSYNVDGGLTSGPDGNDTYGSSSQPHAVTSTSDSYSAAYDAAGDMTCRSLTTATTCSGTQTGQQLSYDPEGRLTGWQNQASSPTSTANYLYDGEGNRVAMLTTVNGTTTLTTYIGSIEEVQTTGSNTTTTIYYTIAGKRVAANVNGTFYYFGYDALGSQVVVLNSSGNLIGSQLYGPYGNPRYSTGILPTSIGFTGQQADSVTGLDYYVARYYDPIAGQFLSADTIQGNAQGMDPYAYVGGNPETNTDPTGHVIDPGSPNGTAIAEYNIVEEAEQYLATVQTTSQVLANEAAAAALEASEEEAVEEGGLTVAEAVVALLGAGALAPLALIGFSIWLMFADTGSNRGPSGFYDPRNGPDLQAGPTPEPEAKPSTSGAGKGGRKPPPSCTSGMNGNAWQNYQAGGGHITDHLFYDEDAENQRFDSGNVYSFFDSEAIGDNAIKQALSKPGQFIDGKWYFSWTSGTPLGYVAKARRDPTTGDWLVTESPAYTVTVVFSANCMPITAYISKK
jgi:RHS repeat-associated protein